MLTPKSRLRPNEGEVAAKVMDGEAILIHVSSGMYHSMDGVGGLIWECIEHGCSLNEIAAAVTGHYDVTADQASADVQRVAEQLLAEGLVIESTEPRLSAPVASGASRLPYEPPHLSSYRDMSDLLALDPPMPGLQQIPWDQNAA